MKFEHVHVLLPAVSVDFVAAIYLTAVVMYMVTLQGHQCMYMEFKALPGCVPFPRRCKEPVTQDKD
jgi:hypothetical protein